MCANISRLFKYLVPAYVDEFDTNLRAYIVGRRERILVHSDIVPEAERAAHDFRCLYGSRVFPESIVRLLNVDVRLLRHAGPPGTSVSSVCGGLCSELYKRVFLVETRPIVTRFWLFGECAFALLLVQLLDLPPHIFSLGLTHARPENEQRMTRFRAWWQQPETEGQLKRACLCLRLTTLALDISAQKPQPGKERLPTIVRLGKMEVEQRTAVDGLEH